MILLAEVAAPENLERHPLSAIWGDMPQEDFDDLVINIGERGLINPIVLFEGKVLDGWHRYKACKLAYVEPRFVEYDERHGDAAGYVISMNSHRRHLTATQRATMVSRCRSWLSPGRPVEEGAKETGSTDPVSGSEQEEAASEPASTEQIARESGTSEATVKRVKKGIRAGHGEAMAKGEMSAREAARRADEEEGAPPKPKPPTRVERLEAKIDELTLDAQGKAAEIEALKEKVRFFEDQTEGTHDASKLATLNSQREQIVTLKGQVGEWQTKYNEELRHRKAVVKERDRIHKKLVQIAEANNVELD